MEGYDDRTAAVAAVYADAVLELAAERGEEDEVREELDALAGMVRSDRGFREFLSNPAIDSADRAESLERTLSGRTSGLVLDTLQVMNRKGRLGLLPALAVAYRASHDRLRHRVVVKVTSAVPLADAQRDELAAAIEAATRRTPSFEERVDPGLLGGLVVQIGDRKADNSVATRLKNLSKALLGASRQMRTGSHVEGNLA